MSRADAGAELKGWLHAQHYEASGAAALSGKLSLPQDRPLKEALDEFRASAGTARLTFIRYLRVLSEMEGGAVLYPTPVTASAGGEAPLIGVFFSRERGSPPSHVWCGGSFESRDGEFRELFLRIDVFLEHFQPAPALEAAILEALESQKVELVVGGGAGAVATWADECRAALMVFAYLLRPYSFPPSLSAPFGAFAAELRARAPGLFGAPAVAPAQRVLYLCAKLVPLYAREVTHHDDLRLGAWREHAAERAAADLALNSVCPGLPLYAGDHLVVDSRSGLYNNPAMKGRFARSLAARRVTARVRAARAALRGEPALAGSERGAKLDARLLGAVEYAQSFALVSGVASLHVVERAGDALGSIPAPGLSALIRTGAPPGAGAAPPPPPGAGLSAELGAGFVFSFAFALHCLHSRARVAHGDLHINNLVTRPWWPGPPGRAVFYEAGPDPADVYCFPAPRTNPAIIDFSRSLLGPGFAGAGPPFFADQGPRALRALHALSPEFVADHEAPLLALLELKPGAGFALLCAADFLALGRALAPALAGGPAAAAAAALEAAAGRAFSEALFAAAAAASASDFSALPGEGPGLGLLRAAFAPHSARAWLPRAAARAAAGGGPPPSFADGYSALAPLRFSVGGPGGRGARRPPWADPAELSRRLGGLSPAEAFSGLARPPPPVAPARRAPAWDVLVAAEAEAQAAEAREAEGPEAEGPEAGGPEAGGPEAPGPPN